MCDMNTRLVVPATNELILILCTRGIKEEEEEVVVVVSHTNYVQ